VKHENSQVEEYLDVSLDTDSTLVKQIGTDFYSLTKKGSETGIYVFKHRNLEYGSKFLVKTI